MYLIARVEPVCAHREIMLRIIDGVYAADKNKDQELSVIGNESFETSFKPLQEELHKALPRETADHRCLRKSGWIISHITLVIFMTFSLKKFNLVNRKISSYCSS